MARNPLPRTLDRLFTLATDMIDGASSIGSATGVVQNTSAVLSTALAATRAAEAGFQVTRQEKIIATTAQTTADSNAKAFIATTKRVLISYLGATWSTAWAQVGFVNGSLETPTSLDERFSLLAALQNYLTAQPDSENTPLGITAAAAQALHNASATARAATNTALRNLATARLARETTEQNLRTRMRGLITELDTLLSDEDPRWYAFGLNAPGDPETPGIPAAPMLTPGVSGSGMLFLDWPDTRRSERYRVWQQVGNESTFTSVATVTESDATLTDSPVGIPIAFQISALNEAGESVPSPVSRITLS